VWTGLSFDLPGGACASRLVGRQGETIALDLARWLGDATAAERRLLDMAVPPVLDIGCGPGRLAAELHCRGVDVLGIDVAPDAVSLSADRGAPVLRRSVFDDVPGAGGFGSALLVDGNLGIGGHPLRLLRRVKHLLRPGGLALAEVEPPGAVTRRLDVRLETASGLSDWSAWAQVGANDVSWIGAAAGYALVEIVAAEDRWFAVLQAAG